MPKTYESQKLGVKAPIISPSNSPKDEVDQPTDTDIIQYNPHLEFDSSLQKMYFDKILGPKLTMYGHSLKVDKIQDPLLFSFIEAVSTAHRFVGQAEGVSSMSIVRRSRSSAIVEFKQKIVDFSTQNVRILFVSNVFLSLLDGVIYPKQDDRMPLMHLQGGRLILNRVGNYEDQMATFKDPTSVMMLSYFGTLDLTNCVLNGSGPHFSRNFWLSFVGKEGWWGTLEEDVCFLEILGGISEIAKTILIADEVPPLTDLLSIQSFFERRVSRNSDQWENFCSAFSLAGLIYFYRKVCDFTMKDPLIQQAVTDFIFNLEALQNTNLQHCLLFPLLVIGTHCIHPEQQEVIRKSVIASLEHLWFGSVKFLWNFLEEKWSTAQESVSWCDDFKDVSNTVFLF